MTISLQTDRLSLRPIAPEDAAAHIAMMQSPAVAAFLSPTGEPEHPMVLWRQFATLLGHWQIRGFGFFSVIERSTGEWIGRVGPWQPEGWPALEIGWAIVPEKWGQGFAPEAAIATARWIFNAQPQLPAIISLIDPQNENSGRVAAKIGEARTGRHFDYVGHALEIWEMRRADLESRYGEG